METSQAMEIDAWLRGGGIVVTASERAARFRNSSFQSARLAEGLEAWPTPKILDWNSFVRSAFSERNVDGRLMLNRTQEQALWARFATADEQLATQLEGPRYRLADLAMGAHELLCSYDPRLLKSSARSGWQNDAAAFSRWLNAFEDLCRDGRLISPARLPIELLRLLQNSPAGDSDRPPLLLAGFDRILPVQRAVFDEWGAWQEATTGHAGAQLHFHKAVDDQAELAACASWCSRQLAGDAKKRILVVTQDARARRGQIERAFLKQAGLRDSEGPGAPLFEFSLGIPLAQGSLPRAALLLLRWFSGPVAEHELDWLFSTGRVATDRRESSALQAAMREIRRSGREQPSWTLEAFRAAALRQSQGNPLPALWVERMARSRQRVNEFSRRPRSPLEWAELVPQILEDAGWPGEGTMSSAEFQAAESWQQALDTCASLGFDGRRMDWNQFLGAIARVTEETLFAPESRDAPILITGPAESAGLTADALWFLGATEDAWPDGGATHPLLPLEVQRQARMPHATPQLDWELAQAISLRLAASAGEVGFSYAAQVNGTESRPSRLIAQIAGEPEPMPAVFAVTQRHEPLTISVEDSSRIPYPAGVLSGGAQALNAQSHCPFKAFATARLDARGWEAANAGLTRAQRGNLLHEVLHLVWGGAPHGIRTYDELQAIGDKSSWVATRVSRVFATKLDAALRERMPLRYLELEQERLTQLVAQWLLFEATRYPFEVLETEAQRDVEIAGLTFRVRLDRLDRLNDGSVLVIDYKSGDIKPQVWDLPRPEDIQLPLYACWGLGNGQDLGGLVFAKLRAGTQEFAGCVGAPAATLLPGLKGSSALEKNRLSDEQLMDWRRSIEQLAIDFLEGKADVDPREPPDTCERCGLQTLCRIQERAFVLEDEGEGAEARDE